MKRLGIGFVTTLVLLGFATVRADNPWTWVSLGGGSKGAIKVDSTGAVLAQTDPSVVYTFNALCVNAFTGDLWAWYNVSGDDAMSSRLFRFSGTGSLLSSKTGLRQMGGGIQKTMALDCVDQKVVFMTAGGYYAGAHRDGIQKFELNGGSISQVVDQKLATANNNRVFVDADVGPAENGNRSRVYYGAGGVTAGNIQVFDGQSDFTSILASNTVCYLGTIRGLACYQAADVVALPGGYNYLWSVRASTLAKRGSSPNSWPNPPFGTGTQYCPSTNGLWGDWFEGNPNASAAPEQPPLKGLAVDDESYMWLSETAAPTPTAG